VDIVSGVKNVLQGINKRNRQGKEKASKRREQELEEHK